MGKKKSNVNYDLADMWMYDVTLNQTNIKNNNNKFYKIKIEKDGPLYVRHVQYGRVGEEGRPADQKFPSYEKAVDAFLSTFFSKTRNHWEDRHSFVPKKGKYIVVKLAENEKCDDEEGEVKQGRTIEYKESELEPKIKEFVELIADKEMIREQMQSFDIDCDKLPIGTIDKKQIEKGFEILGQIQEEIKNPGTHEDGLEELCNDFYSNIPHYFGRRKPDLIKSEKMVQSKIEMLKTLTDIEEVQNMLKVDPNDVDDDTNPVDKIFKTMNVKMEHVPKHTEEFKIMDKYVRNGHGPTHKYLNLKLRELYKIERPGESKRFEPWKDNDNRQLLWHGSRMANWMSILTNGLKIDPPKGVHITGKMFGGSSVYTANICTKSANYCNAQTSNQTGVMVLLETALGDTYNLLNAEQVTLKKLNRINKHSTWGQGYWVPDPKDTLVMDDGCKVPLGKPVKSNIPNVYLRYDEFIVYDQAQFRMRYVLVLDFK